MRPRTYPPAAMLVAAALATSAPAAHARSGEHVAGCARDPAVHRHASGDVMRRLQLTEGSVSFESDSFSLSPDAMRSLDRFARRLEPEARDVRIEAVGYADSTGSSPYNLQLAERRATAVLHYLHERGVSLLRMSAVSYGPGMPRTSNATAEGRAENRRVVIVVLPWKGGARET